MQFFRWISDNILFICTLTLLAFIPLYPKLPLLDVKNTWVYIRAEDFIVVFTLLVWAYFLMRKKITFKTPLTLPILLFWLMGAIATIHGMIVIFPTIANVFPNVAFLSYLRRIEYISVFFIASSAMKDKRFLAYVIAVLLSTFFLIFMYGIGQKYFGFNAYLTMNEEFAKGEAIQLSSLGRIPSTFAGHYDLAAYLVLILPIFASLIFGVRNIFIRLILAISVMFGFVLMFMTVSRVSFVVLLAALFTVLLFNIRKKSLILSSFLFLVIASFIFLVFSPTLWQRFGNTLNEVDVLVDAKTGQSFGNVKMVPAEYFKYKEVKQKYTATNMQLIIGGRRIEPKESSPSAIVSYTTLPTLVPLLLASNVSTGESLPQGTGYINLALSPVKSRVGQFLYERTVESDGQEHTEVLIFFGDFLIKRATAYDLSFTTRFQGEWPRTFAAFKRNILFGSGYGSVSLAVDNNYLRILGETGLLGFASFLLIFIVLAIYMRRILSKIDSPLAKSFILGVASGIVGLFLNATLIDVFEASKVAFVLWLLIGITAGLLALYETTKIENSKELIRFITSPFSIIAFLFLISIVVYGPMTRNFFIGDDFTWFKWITECGNFSCIPHFFTESDGFFYRPGPKLYFFMMYKLFWLNQNIYHTVSILLHFGVASLFFFLTKKLLNSTFFAFLASLLFLILSGYSESLFWISTTQFLFNALFIISSLLFFIAWEEKKRPAYIILTVLSLTLSLFFHELGVVAPLFLILYKFTREPFKLSSFRIQHLILFLPIFPYLLIRYLAHSHWFSGDYNYNLVKLPFNLIGNSIGYILLTGLGPISSPVYQASRIFLRGHIALALFGGILFAFAVFFIFKFLLKHLNVADKRAVVFGLLFFIIALLPFLGLGDISSRYSYLASFGFVIIFVVFIKNIYIHLIDNGKITILLSCGVIIVTFCLFQIMQIQKAHSDWYEAGEKSRRFFISIDEKYTDSWSREPLEFHFVNVPIKQGDAWVFPVGLPDALWLITRNPNIRVYQWPQVIDAQNFVTNTGVQKIFEFAPRGNVIEIKPNNNL